MSTSDKDSPPHRTTPEVFLGYRRHSNEGYAHLLSRDLIKEFGSDAVFIDVERLGGGDKFLPKIYAALGTCNTFLALISPGWLKEAGRLHDPEDFVRMEIAAALASDVKIIPVLLNGAQMPDKKELPDDIRELVAYQAEELRDTRWDDDVRHLIEVIRAPFPKPTLPPPPPPTLLDYVRGFFGKWQGKAALLALLLAAGFTLWRLYPTPPHIPGPNDNVNLITPTPVPTQTVVPTQIVVPIQTVVPTQTPIQTPTPPAKCFREFLPEGRWTSINYGDPDDRVVIRRDQSKDGPAGILLTNGGRVVGAIRFHFGRYGKDEAGNDSGYYYVEQVIGPDCGPVTGYSLSLDDEGQAGRSNWAWLDDIPLDGRPYDMRIAYQDETIVAQFKRRLN
ncbi:MAG: hypothetical protein QOH49_1501 [Acidobacteriota bacterium]|jgi:hypothetical protein|nr:hypothetical protein [Acidobacteriota bacterium]